MNLSELIIRRISTAAAPSGFYGTPYVFFSQTPPLGFYGIIF
jgi:hypothetical protein